VNAAPEPNVVVIGLGNLDRSDDGIGPVVARRAARITGLTAQTGPPACVVDLLDRWQGADLAIVVDAIRSGARPGTVRVFRSGAGPVPADTRGGTHNPGLADALRLSRAIGNAPTDVVVVGIEGQEFGPGDRLSAPVAAVVPGAVRTVVGLIEEARPCA
jgi:hydrogenase maturation protease